MSAADNAVAESPTGSSVLTLTGYGVRVAVERGHLLVEDGAGRTRRTRRLPRVGSGVRRVVILGHAGTVSLEALRWLHDLRISVIHIDGDGAVIAYAGAPTVEDVKLRRAQSLAPWHAAGLQVSKALLSAKVRGQADVVRRIAGARALAPALREIADEIDRADTIEHARYLESRAAAAYWDAWGNVAIQFAGKDALRIPVHWRTFGGRRSLLGAGPRKAVNPANALLNYLYAILEAEARIASLAVGCDPAIGIVHRDRDNRDSFATDLMEPVRPEVDAYVLDVLERRTFLRADFFETREGVCRIMPELARPLAETSRRWAHLLAPIAEEVAGMLSRADLTVLRTENASDVRPTSPAKRHRTPLTQRNRSRPVSRPTLTKRRAVEAIPARCRNCGAELPQRHRTLCDDCLPAHAQEVARKAVEKQRLLRAAGEDARSHPETRRKHADYTRRQMAENTAWEREHGGRPSRDVFLREIAPQLRSVPSEELSRVTGLTVPFCTKMRKAELTPHPRHWDAIRKLLQAHEAKAPNVYAVDLVRPDMVRWRKEIKPHLRRVGATAIQKATGLSFSYARRIVGGHHIPKPQHWSALLALIAELNR